MSDALRISELDGELRINVVLPLAPRVASTISRVAGGLTPAPAATKDDGPLKDVARLGISHTANFAVVRWGKEVFTFTEKQRKVVANLVAAINGGAGVGTAYGPGTQAHPLVEA